MQLQSSTFTGQVVMDAKTVTDRVAWDDSRFDTAFRHFRAGDFPAALQVYAGILAESPAHPRALYARGVVLHYSGESEAGIASIKQALTLKPDYPDALKNLGSIYLDLGRNEDALVCLGIYLDGNPADAVICRKYIKALNNLKMYPEVQREMRRLAAISPLTSEDYIILGEVALEIGAPERARRLFRQACDLPEKHVNAYSNLLYALNLCPAVSQKAVYRTSRQWGEQFDAGGGQLPFGNAPDPDRPLRIGFVSGDFKLHPVSYHLEPLLRHMDRDRFSPYLYSNFPQEDEFTDCLRSLAAGWRNISACSDAEVEALVRGDEIDILLDLSGHTACNRLGLFIRRAAPLQVSWLGYFNTCGLTALDYLFTDAVTVPAGEEAWFAEKIVRLPVSRFCYRAPDFAPQVAPLPALNNGFITFGSFNRLEKISAATVALWSAVLLRLPAARLVVKSSSLEEPLACRNLRRRFLRRGIAAERLDLRGSSPHPRMLAEYADIDIALDTYPFNGGATTCEALWMGVPVVTLSGRLPISRQSAAILAATGNESLAAGTVDSFVDICLGIASDISTLAAARNELRGRMAASYFCDGPAFSRNFEAALRLIWREWCAGRPPQSPR